MNVFTRLALWWLARRGAAVELRLVKLNDKRPGIQGTRLGSYASVAEARQAFQHARKTRALERGSRLTLSLRYVLAETWDPAYAQEAANQLMSDRMAALSTKYKPFVTIVPGADGQPTAGVMGDSGIASAGFAAGSIEAAPQHQCNADGPLEWTADGYVQTCSVCRKPPQ